MVAAFQRTLRPGTEYARYFTLGDLQRTDPVVMKAGDTFDTIDLMAKLARQYQADTAQLAPVLRGKSLEQTCRNNWNFAYHHFQYKEDKSGVEQLRRPLRAWADRRAGIDCDCYSILLSTLLLNQGIAHKLRKTKYQNRPDYQHIYVVVPKPGGGYYTLDPVTDAFDKEVPYTEKFDKDMMPIQVLNGPSSDTPPATTRPLVPKGAFRKFGFGAEFVGLLGETEQVRQQTLSTIRTVSLQGLAATASTDVLPSAAQVAELAAVTGQSHEEATADAVAVAHASASFVERLRQMLANTVEQFDKLPQPDAYVVRTRYRLAQLLRVWDNEPERTRLFVEFSVQEDADLSATTLNGMGLGSWLSDGWDAVTSSVSHAASAVGNAVSTAVSTAGHAVAQAASWTYGNIVKPVGQAVTQAASWTANTVTAGVKAAASAIKKAAVWVAQEAVQLSKLVMKYNPLTVLIRTGMRLAFRVNLFYMSGRLGHAYFSEEQARAAGFDIPEWQKCKSQLGKLITMWDLLQGDQQVLRDSIMLGYTSGKQVKIPGTPALNGLSGLGGLGAGLGTGEPVSTTATVAASSTFIATIIKWLKSVDWGKLLGTASTLAEKLLANKQAASVPTVTENTPLPTSESDYAANKAAYESGQSPTASSSTIPLLLAGGLAAAALLLPAPKPN